MLHAVHRAGLGHVLVLYVVPVADQPYTLDPGSVQTGPIGQPHRLEPACRDGPVQMPCALGLA